MIFLTNPVCQTSACSVQHYNHCIFQRDLAEYAAEGIETTSVEAPNNQPTLDLISGPMGLFPLLDDQARTYVRCAPSVRNTISFSVKGLTLSMGFHWRVFKRCVQMAGIDTKFQ